MSDRLHVEVKQLQKDLEKSLSNDEPTDRVLDILKSLEQLKFTSALIVSSKIANTINATKKKFSEDITVKSLCKQLIQTWKSVYKNETATTSTPSATTPTVKTNTTASTESSSPIPPHPPTLQRVDSNRSDMDDADDCEKMTASYPEGRRKVRASVHECLYRQRSCTYMNVLEGFCVL